MPALQNEISKIRLHVKKLEQVVQFLASDLTPPIFYASGKSHEGFRYMKPTIENFCVTKAVKAISGLNASLVLAEKGFNQEICVLIRTMAECTTHIEYALSGYEGGILAAPQQKFITDFFEDFQRNSSEDFKGSKLRQEEIHKKIANFLSDKRPAANRDQDRLKIKNMLSNVYQTFSNYVHGKYPEIMDLFGGEPLHFHMDGMLNTPKDQESLALIANFANGISITLALVIQKSSSYEKMMAMPEFDSWFKTEKQKTARQI